MKIETKQVKTAVEANGLILISRAFFVNRNGVEGGCALCQLAIHLDSSIKDRLRNIPDGLTQRDIVLDTLQANLQSSYSKDYAYGFINGFDLQETCTSDPEWRRGWKDGKAVRHDLMSLTVGIRS